MQDSSALLENVSSVVDGFGESVSQAYYIKKNKKKLDNSHGRLTARYWQINFKVQLKSQFKLGLR